MQECGLPTISLRNERLVAVFEHAFVTLIARRFLKRGIDRFDGRFLLQDRGEIGHRSVRRRNPKRAAIQFSFQLRKTSPIAFAAPVLDGMMLNRRRPGTPQIFMRQIENALVVRVAVDRAHEAVHDPEIVVQHFRHRRETVGRAARVRNDVVFGRIINIVVDPEANGRIRIFRRRADQDFRARRLRNAAPLCRGW